jgi:hypothetical protein
MKKTILPVLVAAVFMVIGCTDNMKARKYGGKETMKLKPNERLLNITWNGNDLWMLTEDTITHLQYFRESSSFGVWEGEITITN